MCCFVQKYTTNNWILHKSGSLLKFNMLYPNRCNTKFNSLKLWYANAQSWSFLCVSEESGKRTKRLVLYIQHGFDEKNFAFLQSCNPFINRVQTSKRSASIDCVCSYSERVKKEASSPLNQYSMMRRITKFVFNRSLFSYNATKFN